MRQNQPITVELEEEQASLERHLASGDYDSPSEVLRAGLRALDREHETFEQTIRERVKEALESMRPAVPLGDVIRRLRQRHVERWGKEADEAG